MYFYRAALKTEDVTQLNMFPPLCFIYIKSILTEIIIIYIIYIKKYLMDDPKRLKNNLKKRKEISCVCEMTQR